MSGQNGSYTVDLARLDATTELIARFVSSLSTTMENIDSDVVQRLAQVWGGEASQAYQDRQRAWTAAMTRASGEVEEMRIAARLAHGNYTAARAANLSMLGR